MVKKTRDPIVISDDEKKVIDQFIDHLWLEDGLAKNTLESYRFDLMQFSEFLNGNIKKILFLTRLYLFLSSLRYIVILERFTQIHTLILILKIRKGLIFIGYL